MFKKIPVHICLSKQKIIMDYCRKANMFVLCGRIEKEKWKLVGVMVVRNPFDMIATRTAMETVLKFTHPLTHSPTWVTFHNCSKVQPNIRDCERFMRGSISNGTMKIVHSSDVDDNIKTIRHHAKARYHNTGTPRLGSQTESRYVQTQMNARRGVVRSNLRSLEPRSRWPDRSDL